MKRKSLSKFLSIVLGMGIVVSSTISVSAQNISTTSTVGTQQVMQNTYGSFKYTNAYLGPIGKANFNITNGATTDIDVAINASGVTSEKDLKAFIRDNKTLFTSEQYSKIVALPAYTNEGYGAELLAQLYKIVFNDNSYKNVNGKSVKVLDIKQKKLLSGLEALKTSNCILKGKTKAISESYIPTLPYCFTEVSKLQFDDGKTLKVVNTSVLIGDSTGSTSKVHIAPDAVNLQLIEK